MHTFSNIVLNIRRIFAVPNWVNIRQKVTTRGFLSLSLLAVILFFFIWTNPGSNSNGTVKIFDKNGVLLFELAGNTGRKQVVTFDRFPQHLINAVVASEDEAFFSHPGIDVKAIARSAFLNIRAGEIISGASTITQQVARLHTDTRPSNIFSRFVVKIREIIIALRLSIAYSKQDILTMYLNEVYLGNHNYGFQSAAQFYFHKNIDKLSVNESAYLAGIIASPSKYDPYNNLEEGEKRKAYVLERMGALGYLTREEIDTIKPQHNSFADPDSSIKAPHFVDYINRQLETLHVPLKKISVYTTLDSNAYDLSQRIALEWVKKLEAHNIHNAAMVVLDNKTGAVIAMLGGVNYFDWGADGQVNLATSPRQPGSAIKPITYSAAFLKGYTPATLIYDVKKSYRTKKDEGFIPNNFGDRYHGLVLAREALASSYNLPAVELLSRIGVEVFVDTARSMGITSFKDASEYDYAITLGASEVSLLELANAYATLARSGNFIQTYAIEKVTDDHGKVLYAYQAKQPVQVLGPNGEQVSYLITDILSDEKARMPGFGEDNYLTLSRPAAVKTGTTTDWHDIWTIGYTPSYTVGVWMGNNDNTPMRNISSATGAAPVWNQFFEEFLKGKEGESFKKPDDLVEKEICTMSGDLYDSLCPEHRMEIFVKGTEPSAVSNLHKIVDIDTRNGLKASALCPQEFVAKRLLINYPPEVYTWAVNNHQTYIPADYSPLCEASPENEKEDMLFISITNPKAKAIYQNAPQLIKNQGISLEVNVSGNINRVIWYVDGTVFAESTTYPYSVIYPLQSGKHLIYAKGISKNKQITSDTVTFNVTDI